jgi:hypothetical protein
MVFQLSIMRAHDELEPATQGVDSIFTRKPHTLRGV